MQTVRAAWCAGVSAAAPAVFCSPHRWACPFDIYIITYPSQDVNSFFEFVRFDEYVSMFCTNNEYIFVHNSQNIVCFSRH